VACSPLVIANVRSGFAGLATGLRVQDEYAAGEALGLAVYGRRLGAALSLLADSMSGTLSELDGLRGPLDSQLGLIVSIMAMLGLALAARRGSWLPLFACISYVVLLPIVNARFEPSVPKARYIAPLLPLCSLAIGLLIVGLYRRVVWLLCARARASTGLTVAAHVGMVIGVVGLLIGPLSGLQTYYRQASDRGRTNADLYGTIAAVNAARRPGDRILVDRALLQAYTPGGGRMYEHLQFAGSVYGWNRLPIDLPMRPEDPLLHGSNVLVVAKKDLRLALTTLRLQETDDAVSDQAPARVLRILGPNVP
jgi:hypothetical protein